MDDGKIVELCFQRNEGAIGATSEKYGAYCMKISMNILNSIADSEECVNDTYLQTWNSIPPNRPQSLTGYLAKITRNLAINRYKARRTDKRAADEFALSLDELDACVPGNSDVERQLDVAAISRSISRFLWEEPTLARRIFVLRYFHCETVVSIADRFGYSQSKVKSILFRTRGRLKSHLESEGIAV